MYCKHCGKEIADDSVFCKYCGGKTDDAPVKDDEASYSEQYEDDLPLEDDDVEYTGYNPKEKIPIEQVFGSAPKEEDDFSVREWIVGFRSGNAVCMVFAAIWYAIMLFGWFSGSFGGAAKTTSALCTMIAWPYIIMGAARYKRYNNSKWIIVIGVTCLAVSALLGQLPGEGKADKVAKIPKPTAAVATASPTKTPEESKADLEKSKQELKQSVDELKDTLGIKDKPEDEPFNPAHYTSAPEYEELARYPGNYENGKYKFYGKAVQVSDGVFNTKIRLELNDDIDQIIYCEAPNDMFEKRRLLEGDYATFYGIYKGVTTYTSVLGANITVPKITVTQWMP